MKKETQGGLAKLVCSYAQQENSSACVLGHLWGEALAPPFPPLTTVAAVADMADSACGH